MQCPFGSLSFTCLILFHQMKTIHLRIVCDSLVFLKILDCTVKSVLITCYTLTRQADFRFSLFMQMFGLHSPSRFFFFFHNLTFFSRSHLLILSLSKQVVGSQSRCRCLVYTGQADVGFSIFHRVLS